MYQNSKDCAVLNLGVRTMNLGITIAIQQKRMHNNSATWVKKIRLMKRICKKVRKNSIIPFSCHHFFSSSNNIRNIQSIFFH